ncbi:MAG: sulfatase-like hydrolase/transferase, partial [bacterium]
MRLSRRRLLASLAPPLRQPHVLILQSDDQRADTIGALGNPWIETPNLDRLVKRGTAFRNCYNQGGHQPAVCV